MKIKKTTVNTPTRKLKATWTVESYDDWIPLLNNKLVAEDVELSTGTKYLVVCNDCTQARQIEIVKWLIATFNTGYRIDEDYIIFEEEKHRTLMLMRWSSV